MIRRNEYAHLEKKGDKIRFGCIRGGKYIYELLISDTPRSFPTHITEGFHKEYLISNAENPKAPSTWKTYGPFSLDEVREIQKNPEWLGLKLDQSRYIDVATGAIYCATA